MAVTPAQEVAFPKGRLLALTWLTATLAAATPAAIAIVALPDADLAQTIAWPALLCSPLASAAALALCRRTARSEPLTGDSVIALYWLTGAVFAFAIPPLVGLALLAAMIVGSPGPFAPGGVAGAVVMFLFAWLMAAVVGVIGATPFALFAGYVARWTGFRSSRVPAAAAASAAGPGPAPRS